MVDLLSVSLAFGAIVFVVDDIFVEVCQTRRYVARITTDHLRVLTQGRQRYCLRTGRIPAALRPHVDQAQAELARQYQLDRSRFSFWWVPRLHQRTSA